MVLNFQIFALSCFVIRSSILNNFLKSEITYGDYWTILFSFAVESIFSNDYGVACSKVQQFPKLIWIFQNGDYYYEYIFSIFKKLRVFDKYYWANPKLLRQFLIISTLVFELWIDVRHELEYMYIHETFEYMDWYGWYYYLKGVD